AGAREGGGAADRGRPQVRGEVDGERVPVREAHRPEADVAGHSNTRRKKSNSNLTGTSHSQRLARKFGGGPLLSNVPGAAELYPGGASESNVGHGGGTNGLRSAIDAHAQPAAPGRASSRTTIVRGISAPVGAAGAIGRSARTWPAGRRASGS